MEYQPEDADVVIIGAGVSGLTAAHVLAQKEPSLSILVLEATERIGGRTFTPASDIGGQWVSSQQKLLIKLMDQLGIKTDKNRNSRGKVILEFDGKIFKYAKPMDVCNAIDKLELCTFITKIETLCKQESLDQTIASMSVEQYIRNNVSSPTVQAVIQSMILSHCGVETSNISLGFYIFFCISTHGIANQLVSTTNSLRQFWIQNGGREICKKIVDSFEGDFAIVHNSRVLAINDQRFQLEIKTERRSFFSSSVIVAVPPSTISKIEFTPPLPDSKSRILQHSLIMGHLVKFVVTYPEAFWRKNGYSGDVYVLNKYSPSRPLLCCWDVTTTTATLSGFLIQDATNIKSSVLEQLCKYFGNPASTPLDFIAEKWPDGSPMSLYKTFQDFKETRSANGRIVWASAETALEWYGCISGAVYAGNRAAREVLYDIRPGSLTLDDMVFFTSNVANLQKRSQSFTTIYKKIISPYYQVAAFIALIILIRMWRKGAYSYLRSMLVKR